MRPNVKRTLAVLDLLREELTAEESSLSDKLAAADELIAFDSTCAVKEKRARDNLIATGAIKAVRIGRKLFVRRSDLLALVDKLPSVVRAVHKVSPEDFDRDEQDIDRRVLRLAKVAK